MELNYNILLSIVLASFFFRSTGISILSGIISILLYLEVIRNLDGYKANKHLLCLPIIGLAEAFFAVIVWVIIFRGFADNLILEFSLVLILSVFSQLGDLLESYAKRLLSVKDSGGLIPGHGGVFDRMDSFLGAIFGYSLIISLGFGI